MKKAAIYIFGLPALDDKPEAQITVHYNDEKKLMAYLKELQKGYCLDGERPKINKLTHPKTGKIIIECYNECDYRHVAFEGFTIKKEANKPIITLD